MATVEEFAAQARRRRTAKRPEMSQTDLARLSGWSVAAIQKLETRTPPPKPGRSNAIDLARALGWDVDEALSLLGYEPLADVDREQLPPLTLPSPVNYWAELGRIWPRLSGSQQAALTVLAASIVDPQRPTSRPVAHGDTSGEVIVMDTSPDAAGRQRPVKRRNNKT